MNLVASRSQGRGRCLCLSKLCCSRELWQEGHKASKAKLLLNGQSLSRTPELCSPEDDEDGALVFCSPLHNAHVSIYA